MAKQLIGTVKTNDDGNANLDFYLTSPENVIIVAESGDLVSNEFAIYNCIYCDQTSHYYSVNSVNNNIGHYHYDIWYTTTDDVKVSCIVKQTGSGNWYNAGLSICYENPITDTTTNRNNNFRILLAGSNYNGTNGQHKQYVVAQSTAGSDMIFNREYLLEVTRSGNTFYNKITDLTTNTITRESEYTYTGTQELKHWGFTSFEGSTWHYRDVKIIKL